MYDNLRLSEKNNKMSFYIYTSTQEQLAGGKAYSETITFIRALSCSSCLILF